MVGMPDGECRFFILENIEYEGVKISQAEIDWYYIFIANGWAERTSRASKKITNARGSLGAKGRDSAPCVVCVIETGVSQYYPSQNDAAEALDTEQHVLAPMINGEQNQKSGFAARNATAEEVNAVPSRVIGDRDVVWRIGQGGPIVKDMRNECPGCLDEEKGIK